MAAPNFFDDPEAFDGCSPEELLAARAAAIPHAREAVVQFFAGLVRDALSEPKLSYHSTAYLFAAFPVGDPGKRDAWMRAIAHLVVAKPHEYSIAKPRYEQARGYGAPRVAVPPTRFTDDVDPEALARHL